MKVGGLTRRELLRLGGLGIVVGARGCGDNLGLRPPGEHHAAAVLEPESDSFIVTLWAAAARIAQLEVRDPADEVVFVKRLAIDDWHASVLVGDLSPSTSYEVTITTDDGVRLGHRVRTAPLPDDPRAVRIAISADIDPAPEFASDLVEHMLAAEPELFISLGDFPYADNGPIAITPAEYRHRHAEVRTEPHVRPLLEGLGMRAIYDDHEFRNDWDAAASAAEPQRYAAAMQVWDEFFPLRGSPGDVKYRRWRWGAHLECFLLDCRRYRSPNAMPDGPDKTMLGATQLAWLLDAVTTSTATFKLVLTSVPLDFGDGVDHWAGFVYERDLILDAFVGVPGILFVSADQHLFAAHRHRNGTREFQLGPLARGIGVITPETTGVLFRAPQLNFGLFDVDATSLTVTGVGVGGEVFYKETLSVGELTPQVAGR